MLTNSPLVRAPMMMFFGVARVTSRRGESITVGAPGAVAAGAVAAVALSAGAAGSVSGLSHGISSATLGTFAGGVA